MSDDPKNLTLDPCGCCDGLSIDTPQLIENPPGLPAVRYRAGTHATFKSSMLARLATAELEPDPLLGASPSPAAAPDMRSGDDFQVALIDAFAMTADVLTFYQERIANESYLGTSTERRSILELAREIGYELDAGVAAAATLQLITEERPKVAGSVVVSAAAIMPPLHDVPVAAGTKVQSIPGPGEKPQTFETIEDAVAYPEWNEIRPRLLDPVYSPAKSSLWTAGKAEVKKGETIVIHASNDVTATIVDVDYNPEADRTKILFQMSDPAEVLLSDPPVPKPGLTLDQLTTVNLKLSDSAVKDSFESHRWAASDLRMIARLQGWPLDDLSETIRRYGDAYTQSKLAFFTFSVKAAPFGHNAPQYDYVKNTGGDSATKPFLIQDSEFNGMTLDAQGNRVAGRVYLDGAYPDVSSSSLAILSSAAAGELPGIYTVTAVSEATRTSRSINAKVTVIQVAPDNNLSSFLVRTTAILAGSRRFDAPFAPNEAPLAGKAIELDGVFLRLQTGQKLIVSGERDDAPGVFVSEVCVVKEVAILGAATLVELEKDLAWTYVRRTVIITANAAAATHGETVEEILGNGDAGTPYQTFTLRQKPLTYVSAQTPRGSASTLEVQVNDVIWREVPALFGHGPQEHIFVTRRGDDGTITVQFGDGINGARLPTGVANIRAKYRKGIGLEGLVGQDKITLLLSRPLGLKGARNPLPSADAADPQPRDEARNKAPITVLTLDRIVSLRDFEDFVRNYAGVAKALGSWMQGAERRGVFVTVAGQNGNPITNTSTIEKALLDYGNKFVPVKVRSYRELLFRIGAQVTAAPDRIPAVVQTEIEAKLRDAFSFDKRIFGQPVHRSEVIALIQSVAGVLSVNLTKLQTNTQTGPPLTAAVPEGDLAAANDGAQLLVIDPRPVELVVTK